MIDYERTTKAWNEQVDAAVESVTKTDRKGVKTADADFPDASSQGNPTKTVANTKHALRLLAIAVRYDCFRMKYELLGMPGHDFVSDAAARALVAAFQRFGYSLPIPQVLQDLYTIGDEFKFDSMIVLLKACEDEWDGVSRLDTWLARFAKAEDTPFSRFVGASIMIAAVRRVRVPGTPYKYVPVLEGGQDARKSSLLRELAFQEFFDDNLEIGSNSKEVIELLGGKLIVEFAELANKKPAQIEHTKAFLARTVDRARMAYERVVSDMPRRFVCVGTTNESRYLYDATGGVRFWPIKCNASVDDPIDVDGLRAELRQLWGEAAARESKAREDQDLSVIYPTKEMSALARIEQSARFDGDEFFERLNLVFNAERVWTFLNQNRLEGVFLPNEQIVAHLGLDAAATLHPQIGSRIKKAMQTLGWESTSRRMMGIMTRGYSMGVLPTGDLDHGTVLLESNNELALRSMILDSFAIK